MRKEKFPVMFFDDPFNLGRFYPDPSVKDEVNKKAYAKFDKEHAQKAAVDEFKQTLRYEGRSLEFNTNFLYLSASQPPSC